LKCNGARGTEEADKLYKEGLSRVGVTRGFLGISRDKSDQGCVLLTKAANLYKLNQHYHKAGDAFWECTKVQLRMDMGADACGSLNSAAACYSLSNEPQLALKCHQKAASIWLDRSRISMAAKQYLQCGDVFQAKLKDDSSSLEMYKKALELYETEGQPAAAGRAREKVATLQMDTGDFITAKDNFELLGMQAKDHRLLHFGASDHFFKAAMCALAIDHVHAALLLRKYSEQHVEFGRSRQRAFIAELIQSVKEDSIEKFDLAVSNYGLYNTSHPWMFRILQKIRETLPSVCGWSELEGSVPVDENPKSKSNHFLSSMITRGTSLKAFYLQHTSKSYASKYSKTSSAANNSTSQSVKLSDLNSSTNSDLNNGRHKSSGAVNSFNRFDDFDYDDELNPFSENYRDASDEELDLR